MSSSNNDSDSDDDDDINDEDVCFGDESHPGTNTFRKVVNTIAKKKNDEPKYSPAIYRQIKKKMKDVKFYIEDSEGDWTECTKKELVKACGNAYDEAKKDLSKEDLTETTVPAFDDSLRDYPSSPTSTSSAQRGRRASSSSSPSSKRKPRTSSPGVLVAAAAIPLSPSSNRKSRGNGGNNIEPMMKTVSMYFPPPKSNDLPEVTEKLIPLRSCNQETVAALRNPTSASSTATAVAHATTTGTTTTSARVYGSSAGVNTASSSSGVVGMSTATTIPYDGSNSSSGGIAPDSSLYGRSIFQVPNSHNRLVAEAEFENFAPLECICCQQCVGDAQRARTFARVYENRLEVNQPKAPWCCWTPEYCIVDQVQVFYFDNGPSQTFCSKADLDCLAEVCGHPVVFVHVPRMCCNLVDLRPCYGERIYAAPCTCCDLRWPWCCVGRPCYEVCIACPFILSMKNGKYFLAKYRGAVDEYSKTRPIKRHTQFHRVSEKPCGCDKVTVMDSYPVDQSMHQHAMKLKNIPSAIPNAFIMDRA